MAFICNILKNSLGLREAQKILGSGFGSGFVTFLNLGCGFGFVTSQGFSFDFGFMTLGFVPMSVK